MQQNSSLLGRVPAGLVLMLSLVALRLLMGAGVGACLIGSTLVTGRWMSIQNAVGNVAGMTALVVTRYLVASTGNYTSASIVSGVVALCGLVAWLVVVPEVKPIDWKAEQQRLRPETAAA